MLLYSKPSSCSCTTQICSCEQTGTAFIEAELCKAKYLSVRAVDLSIRICDVLQAQRLTDSATINRAYCLDIFGWFSSCERFGHKLTFNDKTN